MQFFKDPDVHEWDVQYTAEADERLQSIEKRLSALQLPSDDDEDYPRGPIGVIEVCLIEFCVPLMESTEVFTDSELTQICAAAESLLDMIEAHDEGVKS